MPNSGKVRDPKVDPQPGDVFFKEGKRLYFTRIVRRIKGHEVLYQDGFGQVCATNRINFANWASKAEVIDAAD